MKTWRLAVPLSLLLVVPAALTAPAHAADEPSLTVTTVEEGLDIPWDLAFLPSTTGIDDGSFLYTERSRKTLSLSRPGQAPRVILRGDEYMWAQGETGLMSVAVDPDFATSREFITCHGYRKGSSDPSIRVVRWTMNSTFTGATLEKTLVSGLPVTTGRHGGCSLQLTPAGTRLYVGTGDAAVGTKPQNKESPGGKVLRIDAKTGAPISTNPFASSKNTTTRKIFTYGHRNVQGLALRADGLIWSAEQGSYRDDEVNLLVNGGNYGWNPVPRKSGDPRYNEGSNSPMTDTKIPGAQQQARWRSGNPTIATSGIDFVKGSDWGNLDGALAVGVLKGERVLMLRLDADGNLVGTYTPPELDGTFDRLRGVTMGPDGSLYVTTSNGGGKDKILKVTPTAG